MRSHFSHQNQQTFRNIPVSAPARSSFALDVRGELLHAVMIMSDKDRIFSHTAPAAFVFDEAVARVFPDMIQRSVPGYASVIDGIGLLAGDYMQPQTNAYDLGCAVGAASLAMLRRIKHDRFRLIAVDNSAPMLKHCQRSFNAHPQADKTQCICADIRNVGIHNASVVVLNYTLQFIPPSQRAGLLARIYRGMKPAGVLILSEKLAFDDAAQQQRQTALHESFKRAQGYSELEISRKRAALENVLIPESLTTHLQRLTDAGFSDAQLWFRSINFASMLAWK